MWDCTIPDHQEPKKVRRQFTMKFAETHCETHVVNVCWEFKYTLDRVLGEWSKHKILGKTVVLIKQQKGYMDRWQNCLSVQVLDHLNLILHRQLSNRRNKTLAQETY